MPELVGTAVATARTGQSLDELRYGEQFSAAHKQIHQRTGNEQPVCVLLQPPRLCSRFLVEEGA